MAPDAPALAGGVWRWSKLLPLQALIVGAGILAAGWGAGADQTLRTWRDQIRMHSASGEIVIVEIDKRSLDALDQWPWPRRYHAQLIDRLRTAEASLIAFDVNFEVQSNPVDDAALEAALKRADSSVALPTFQQTAGAGMSEIVESVPYEPFRNNAFLAGVNVAPDADGLVRSLPLGTDTGDGPRPSMASLMAEATEDIDRLLEIDFAIHPDTIPRLSFVDVIENRFDPALVKGKRLIVGGTAADMQDRYAVPIHGVLPGVVVQMLGAETILAGGVPTSAGGWWPLLLVVLAGMLAVRIRRPVPRALAVAAAALLTLLLPLATEQFFALTFSLAPALVALLVMAAGLTALHVGERLRERSLTDAETGMPNLRALAEALAARRDQVVVVAAIDRFTTLAAGLGASSTAALVHRIADRLRGGEARTIYRTDEHSLAWLEPAQPEIPLDDRLSAIATLMRAPIECGRMVEVTVGMGVAAADEENSARQAHQQQIANAALAAARALMEKLPFLHFTRSDAEQADWHLSLMSELRAAIAAGDLWNAYQPKLDIASGRIIGVEALVRWSHPTRGLVGPDRFVPVVEANGRAFDLTVHVFSQALADARRWHAQGHDLAVAVNVSATLLEDAAFTSWLRDILPSSGVATDRIIVEVTESAAVKDVDQAVAALAEWRALGVTISIDDYGTGQSSLGYLQRLPASELKVDKSFIQTAASDSRNAIMVRSTVALAHQLGLKVVAEGVEDESTLALLREIGCDIAQGWLIGRPVPAADLEKLLSAPASLAA